jgi:hypothetical protein
METAPPVWVAEYTTAPLDRDLYDETVGFLDSIGGAKGFLAIDPAHTRPRWPGAPETTTVSALAPARITIVLATGLKISAGDLIGLEEGGKYGLFRSVETVTASSNSAAFDVHGPIPAHFTTSAAVRLTNPVCEMILDPSSPPDYQGISEPTAISFKAIQRQ